MESRGEVKRAMRAVGAVEHDSHRTPPGRREPSPAQIEKCLDRMTADQVATHRDRRLKAEYEDRNLGETGPVQPRHRKDV